MTRKGPRDSGTDATITPTQAVGLADTNVSSEVTTQEYSTGKLPVRYAVGRQLGAGGMGEVVLATDAQIGRDVAVKRMRVRPTSTAVARFMREAKVQGRLDHPAVVPVHELGIDGDGKPFFVMKRLTGTTLAELLGSQQQPTRQKLLRAFADVCLAIEFAHNRGVIHRDLKPSNIMLGDFGEVYVLDWGVARVVDEAEDIDTLSDDTPSDDAKTEAGAILGTPGYIAPEAIRGEPIDARADVYALGCILFEILTGESLLPRGREALVAALDPFNTRPSTRAPDRDVPPELDEVCVAATSIARSDRPSARALAERIEHYLDGDRDVALRKTLAASHLDSARTALATGDSAEQRATAMREAGQAIALDPQSADAAAFVGRLMLEPPREVPPEVDAAVTAIEERTTHNKVRLILFAMLALLIVIPAVLLIGLRSYLALGAFTLAMAVNVVVVAYFANRQRPPSPASMVVAAIVFALIVGVMSRVFSPFLLAPALAAVTVLLFAVDPRVPWGSIVAIFSVAVLGPWLVELVGWVPRTMSSMTDNMMVRPDIVRMTFPEAELGLALFVIGTLVASGIVAHQLGMRQREAMRSVELQAWHLRQLVRGA